MSEDRKTMTVPQMRKMLGLKKTESYWLVHRNFFKTDIVNGHMMIDVESFEKWYAGQTRYQKRRYGSHVGAKRSSYISRDEAARMAGVTPSTVSRWAGEGYFRYTKTDKILWIKRDSFENWLEIREG